MDACPLEGMNRSRLGQIGSSGSNRRKSCHSTYATGASAIGVPGWPEFAACTASIASVRMVLMLSWSSEVSVVVAAIAARSVGRDTLRHWMPNAEEEKRVAAKAAAALVPRGATIGLGTGSTVELLLPEL